MAKPDRICFEASHLFARYGFEGVSMRQVAEASGVTMSTLYYHFGTKEDLHDEVLRMAFDDFVGQIAARWNASAPAQQTPAMMAGLIFDAVVADPTFFLLMQQELHAPEGDPRRVAALRNQTRILSLLGRAFKQSTKKGADETDIIALAALITGYCEVLYPDRRASGADSAGFMRQQRAALVRHVGRLFDDLDAGLALAS